MDKRKKKIIQVLDLVSLLIDYLVIFVLIVVFLYGLYGFLDVENMYRDAEAKNFTSYKPEKESKVNYSFEELKVKNKDLIGWLDIYGTTIDYPLVQGEDNLKYLNTDIFGNYTAVGSIFLDSRNSGRFEETNNVIYGHHMAHRAMFGDIGLFEEKSFFDSHRYGNLHFKGRDFGIKILAYFKTHGDDSIVYDIKLRGQDKIKRFLSHIDKLSKFDRINDLSIGDIGRQKFVVLSTCTEETGGRQILLGVLSDEKYENKFAEDNLEEKLTFKFSDNSYKILLYISAAIFFASLLIWILCLAIEKKLKNIDRKEKNKFK